MTSAVAEGVRGRRLPAFTFTLFVAMAVATLPLSIYGVISPFLLEDLGMSRSQLGLLLTVTSGVAAVLSPAMGRLTDRIGGRAMVLGTLVGGVFVLGGLALSPAISWLLVAAVFAGIINSAANPSTNRLIGAQVRAGLRGVTIGIKQSGVHGGLALAGAYIPVAALALGWRRAVASMIALPLIGTVLTLKLVPWDPPAPPDDEDQPIGYRHPRAMWWLAGYAFLMGSAQAVLTGFLPLYLHESLEWTVTAAGGAAAALGIVGIAFRIGLGRISERARHISTPLVVQAFCAVASLALIMMAGASALLVWTAVILAGASLAAWNAVAMLAVILYSKPEHTGRASGLVVGGFMAGMTASPVAFGYSVDVTAGYTVGWVGAALCCAAALLLSLRWRAEAAA